MRSVQRMVRYGIPWGVVAYCVGVWLHDNADKAFKTVNHPTPAFTVMNNAESIMGLAIGLAGGAILFIILCRLADIALNTTQSYFHR